MKRLKKIDAEYYVLLNSDVEVTPGWITPIINLLGSQKNFAACQPKILAYKNKKTFEYAGAAGGWLDSYGYPFARGRIFDVCEEDKGQYDNTSEVFWASGAALVIKAEVFHCNDLFQYGSEAKVKEAGKFRVEGKEYEVQDGDVMHFRFNV